MSDYDLASEAEAPGTEALPDWAREQLRKANKEAEGYRQRLRERESEILSSRFADVMDLLPEEVTSYDAKLSYLEKLQSRLSVVKEEAPATPETSAEEPAQEEVVPDADKLAGIVGGPSGSVSPGTGMVSRSDWVTLVGQNPAEAERLFQAGKVNFSDLREGLGPDR